MPKVMKRPRSLRPSSSRDGYRRKHGSSSSKRTARPLKRTKVEEDDLDWRSIQTGSMGGMDGGGGMMMLEELDDIDVEWEEGKDGKKVATFVSVKKDDKPAKGKARASDAEIEEVDKEEEEDSDSEGDNAMEGDEEGEESMPDFAQMEAEELDEEDEDVDVPQVTFDDDLLPAWRDIPLHGNLKRSLLALGFTTPTDIQSRSLPSGLTGRDVVGIAETGSGKTLSYSLPILSHLLSSPPSKRGVRRCLSGLVLCPTRELALQVVDHLKKVVDAMPSDQDSSDVKGPPRISIGSVVGGLSAQKQKRIVSRGCDILVATPGRLWDLIKADDVLAGDIRGARFLIIDEADRMIENGHFAELESIVRLTQRNTADDESEDPVFASTSTITTSTREDMQTFVFSATMSKDLQQNLKRRQRRFNSKGKKMSALEDLVDRLDFRDSNPVVIDLSPEGGTVKTLKESMVECVSTEKDLYLYYFLLRYPGRSLVFVGSIDGIRRLVPLFEVLQVPVFPLHSQLQQKQRLKNLDRFKSSKSGVLIATDVASRGLDIPSVDHVIHFNLPRTADAYIHRSGRTARASNPGFALQLCSPEERNIQRGLMRSLGRETMLPELPIENGFLPKLKERIRLAMAIEKAQHMVKKENHNRNWLKETAEAMDIDLEGEMLAEFEDDSDDDRRKNRKKGNKANRREEDVSQLKAELKERLAEPLMARGVSARYPTSGSKVIIDDLVASTGHGSLLGAKTTKAWDEVHSVKKRSLGNRKRPKSTAA